MRHLDWTSSLQIGQSAPTTTVASDVVVASDAPLPPGTLDAATLAAVLELMGLDEATVDCLVAGRGHGPFPDRRPAAEAVFVGVWRRPAADPRRDRRSRRDSSRRRHRREHDDCRRGPGSDGRFVGQRDGRPAPRAARRPGNHPRRHPGPVPPRQHLRLRPQRHGVGDLPCSRRAGSTSLTSLPSS